MAAKGERSWSRWLRYGAAVAGSTVYALGNAAAEPGTAFTRRITPDQYHAIISDVFGNDITIGGLADLAPRTDGLMAIGDSAVSVSPTNMEQYDSTARLIANQVTDARHRDLLIPCKPKSAAAPDDICARQFFRDIGSLLYRRPLTVEELDLHVKAADAATQSTKDFYAGLALALAGLLSEPEFLFLQERTIPNPRRSGDNVLDAYAKASRLSFFLWNSVPDRLLLAAAKNGELDTLNGLARQVDRMIESPRLESGLRAFFSDMLHFDEFSNLNKDISTYPKFSSQAAADAREQTLKTLVDLLLIRKGDYRDVFTTKHTFMTKVLAAIYRVPLRIEEPNGAPDTWRPYDFAADDPRAGILMQVSFVALNAHPVRSSPTLRGKALREVLLCQRVPPPPGDVKFDIVQDTSNPVYRTARARLIAHRSNPVCAGCHKLVDPIGLALENFDGGGDYRVTENGVVIDTSGELDGVKFASGAELGQVVHDNPAATSCLVDRLSAYALGRAPDKTGAAWVDGLKAAFAADRYVVPALMRRIATSPAFYDLPGQQTKLIPAKGSSTEGRK